MMKALGEAVGIQGDKLTIALDGSWQTRGHKSHNGVVTATCPATNKIIDVAILSNYCECGSDNHKATCQKNFDGKAGAMEVAGAIEIYRRSIERKVEYKYYLGDGDSRVYKAVCDEKLYEVQKLDCIGHVQKRIGTRLRKLKKEKKLKNLTHKLIDKLQRNYGLAVRQNANSLSDMQDNIWASFYHAFSSDETPLHFKCPDDPQTWCKYWKAKIENKIYKHKDTLPRELRPVLKPIYEEFTNETLLQRCLHATTQNVNESFHNVIWSIVSKRKFVRLSVLQLGVYLAVLKYNEPDIMYINKILKKMNIEPGQYTTEGLKRLKSHKSKSQNKTKKSRRVKNENEDDDIDYGYGAF